MPGLYRPEDRESVPAFPGTEPCGGLESVPGLSGGPHLQLLRQVPSWWGLPIAGLSCGFSLHDATPSTSSRGLFCFF